MIKLLFQMVQSKNLSLEQQHWQLLKAFQSLAKALAGKVNGKLVDLTRPIEEDASIEIITPDHEDALGLVRHSAAHLMAQAMRRLYPNIHFGVGPAIDSGFTTIQIMDKPSNCRRFAGNRSRNDENRQRKSADRTPCSFKQEALEILQVIRTK